ncbi:hypothetical protein E1264_02120 [Actinomadura sp. KC216]|uniref:hypothetical protein n=1 Tax=Actinomadura sp. KC216 TaxID=2530370 RepID=UPI00105226B0|nr:hypothetical protein [Actinomadura sp. KC216]TDB91289.1 hypothetical protein E1264_02120 [Actinomadura sp. KC216]
MLGAVVAALGMCADGIGEGLYAVRHGYRGRAAAIGFAIAAVLGALTRVVTPMNFTAESVAVATQAAKERPQIFYIVLLASVPTVVLGATGLYEPLIGLFDPGVVAGAVAGVGVLLASVGFGYIRDRRVAGGMSTVFGVAAFLLTEDLTVTVVASIASGSLAAHFLGARFGEEPDEEAPDAERPSLIPVRWRDMIARPVLIGALSLFALRLGTVVSYETVNGELAPGTEPDLNGAFLVNGAASLASALFGGPPLDPTPSPTAETAMPVASMVIFAAVMAVLAGAGLVERVGRWVPLESVAGFLIVVGAFVVLPENVGDVEDLPDGVALTVTAFTNPFYGIVAGELVQLLH